MKARFVTYSLLMTGAAALASCAAHGQRGASAVTDKDVSETQQKAVVLGRPARPGDNRMQPVAALPSAVIYRTNGDYAENVTMNLDASGQAPVSFPGPGDVGEQSVPLPLADGWLLDRRGGIGPNTVFLKYTYRQYHELQQVPSVSTLMAEIIPGARVVQAYRLPMEAYKAMADTSAVNSLIREGLPGATPLIEELRIEVK